jgi:hypothetical protein
MNPNEIMQIISVYLSGIFVILIGIFGAASGDSFIGLIIMLLGLVITIGGGIYGRKKFIKIKKSHMPEINGLVDQAKGMAPREIDENEIIKEGPKKEEPKKKIKEKVVKYVECPKCKKENDVDAKFCDGCGNKL